MKVGAWVAVAAVPLSVAGLTACQLVAGIEDLELTEAAAGTGAATSSGTASSTSSGGTSGAGGGGQSSSSSSSSGGLSCIESGDPDLIAYYPLDEAGGTIAHDCSGHGHDGVVMGVPVGGGWTPGHFGGGYTPDGNSGCIDLGKPPELLLEGGAFTVAAWAKAKSFAGPNTITRYLVGRAADPAFSGWRVGTNDVAVWMLRYRDAKAATVTVQSSEGQPTDQWVHVVGTFGSGVGKLYLDGVPTGGPGAWSSIAPDVSSTVRIGCGGTNSKYFDGTIDEVRIYKRRLSDAEIAALAAKVK